MPPSLALITDAEQPNSRLVEEARARNQPLEVFSYSELELNPNPQPLASKAVLARFIANGTLEQITFRLSLLKSLEQQGIRVINSPAAIEKSVDKAMTSLLLAQNGVATPPAWAYMSPQLALDKIKQELKLGNKLVLKPLFGAGGNGIVLVEKPQLPEAIQGVWYLQRFINGGGKDWRVMVVGGKVVASMMRVGTSWLTNVNQGAKCIAASPPNKVLELALRATQVLGCDYAGVDVIANRDDDRDANRDDDDDYYVLEVNGIPGFFALEEASKVNVAGAIIENAIQ